MSSKSDVIKVGVVGVGRGQSFARSATPETGMELVALCDTWEERLRQVGGEYGVATYTDFDEFLGHDMDAVVLANYFHEHAPFAVKALRAGKHVMSEVAASKTIAEGVELCRAVESSGKVYMFAENCAFTAAIEEMRRLYLAGEIGEVTYAEGEYNHAFERRARLSISPGMHHWRQWLPPTYYNTHALGPLMYVTDTKPVQVNALSIVEPSSQSPNTVLMGDAGCAVLLRMDNGAVFRVFGLTLSSVHRLLYEFHGDRGVMSNLEADQWRTVRVHHPAWNREEGEPFDQTYAADWPHHGDEARASGHGGGDFWMNYHFARAIRSGQQPVLDVYYGASMAAAAVQAWRSCLDEGRPYPVPDFTSEETRRDYEDDRWSPFPEDAGPGQPPPSIRGVVEPSAEAVAFAGEVWHSIGYEGE